MYLIIVNQKYRPLDATAKVTAVVAVFAITNFELGIKSSVALLYVQF